ncbi:hypothetical protein D3C80_2119830 [compost metagenome]
MSTAAIHQRLQTLIDLSLITADICAQMVKALRQRAGLASPGGDLLLQLRRHITKVRVQLCDLLGLRLLPIGENGLRRG